MTYSKLFAVLAATLGGMWATYAQATPTGSLRIEKQAAEDTLRQSRLDTTLLTPEELALLVEYIPNEPSEVIQDRLSCIESDIPLVFNPFVKAHIDYFTIRNRKYMRTMLTRENVYFPMFEKYLKKYNMPQNMKYLSVVESALNPRAVSRVGAVGLWQFMKPTGKEYGLDQNSYIDERMDPEKATDAACRFLSRLYKYYGDWELAMAAYNCGQGNVNKAIKRAGGGKKGFWEIFPHLPKETRSYVPTMTAIIYAMSYAPEHNIFSDSILYATDVETLSISQAVDLEKLAEELHLPTATLVALNPEIKERILPDHIRNYPLRVPAQRSSLLASASDMDCILAAAKPSPPPVIEVLPTKAPPAMLALSTGDSTATRKTAEVIHIVQKGDNLTHISSRYNVTLEELKAWNRLKGVTIQPNQRLRVRKEEAETSEEKTLLASADTKLADAAATVQEKSTKTALPVKVKVPAELVYHVQPGDTLWNISQRHNGITVEQIKKLNKLKSNELKPGQKLVLN